MQVRLLGPVVLLWDTDRRVDLGTPQQRCVFAALAMTPRQTVPVDTLVARVWGEQQPRNVRTVLYTYVSRLRSLLRHVEHRPGGGAGVGARAGAEQHDGPQLRRRDGGYMLDIDPDQIDLHRARRLAQQARTAAAHGHHQHAAELLADACQLWTGTPLAGISGEWADRLRIGLDHERLALLTERFDTAIRVGQHDAVIGPLSESLASYPLTESLAGLLMLALHRAGRPADALQVYTQLRRRLVDQLGDEPGRQLRRMHEQILRRDPDLDPVPAGEPAPPATGTAATATAGTATAGTAAAGTAAASTAAEPGRWVRLCQLPPDVAHFVGREPQLEQLLAALDAGDEPAVPVVTVTGPPGVGKTALATRVAHQARDRFPDGQWYVRLGEADPAQVASELLEASGVDSGAVPEGLARRTAALRTRLADRRVLLLLDDAADAAQIQPLLPGTAGSAVLVTSQQLLGGLAAATTVRLDPLEPAEATELLSRLVGSDRVASEPEATAEIGAACGRLPLALRIAAARLAAHPEWTIGRFAARLRDHRQRLDELSVDGLAVRTGLQLSYQALDPPLQTALRRAGLLGDADLTARTLGVLTGETGGAVGTGGTGGTDSADGAGTDGAGTDGAGTDGTDGAAASDGEWLVEGLITANLLDPAGSDATGEPRYRLHELVTTYATELAGQEPPADTEAALRRHLATLLTLADAAYRRLHVDTTDLPPADRPIPRALPAADLARLTADPVAWLIAERTQLVAAIEQACRQGWPGEAALLADRVLTHVLRVHIGPQGIRRLFEAIRDAADRTGDELVSWRARCRLATERAVSGQIEPAAAGLLECADAFDRLHADAELAFSLAEAAKYRAFIGGGAELVPQAERAVRIAQRCGGAVEALATRNLASVLTAAGRYGEALPLFEQVIAQASTRDLIAHRTVALLGLGVAAYDRGDLDWADRACQRATALVDGTTDPRGVAYLQLLSARIATARDRLDEARHAAQQARSRFADLGDARGHAYATAAAGRVHHAAGEPGLAAPLLESAAAAFGELGMATQRALALATLAEARSARANTRASTGSLA